MNLCPPDCPCLLHPLCIVWWKCGCPCMAVCLCPSHLISVPPPCFECVHTSVHVFMSIWLPMLTQPLMDSYMETWVPLCGSGCVSQSPCFWSHTLVRMVTCISSWIYVHLTVHVCSTPMHSLMDTWVPLCGIVCLSQSPYFWSYTLVRMCTSISTWIYVNLTAHVCSTPMDSLMDTWVPMYVSDLCPRHLISVPTPSLECVHESVHIFMST